MPRGKTSLKFNGGFFDGLLIENVSTLGIRDQISIPLHCHIVISNEKEAVSILHRKDGSLNKDWAATASCLYEKIDRKGPGVEYRFVETRAFTRCAARTQKGTWCKNHARAGSILCETSHKQGSETVSLMASGFVLEELEFVAGNDADHIAGVLLAAEAKIKGTDGYSLA